MRRIVRLAMLIHVARLLEPQRAIATAAQQGAGAASRSVAPSVK